MKLASIKRLMPATGPGSSDQDRRRSRQQRLRDKNLTQLARQFGTGKVRIHNYPPQYERHLEHLRDSQFALLEIGIGGYARSGQGGGSLRMWRAYFGRARIVGLDIQDKSFVEGPRITTVQGSQADEELLRRISAEHGPFRVVVDDGSHRPEHIRESFRVLFPLLEDGGVYVIEDTQTSYWPQFGGSTNRDDPTTTMALVKELIDGLNHAEFLDEDYTPSYTDEHVVGVHCYHNLVFIEKGDNAGASPNRDRLPREKRLQDRAR